MNHSEKEDARQRWQRIRAAGKKRYILMRWVLPMGVPLGILMGLAAMAVQALRNNHPVSPIVFTDTPRMIFYLVLYLFFVGGLFAFLGSGRWAKNEKRFPMEKQNDEP